MERAATCGSGRADRIRAEGSCIEKRQSIPRIRIDRQRSAIVIRQVQEPIVHAIRVASLKRIIAAGTQGNGKTRAGASDAGERPSLCETTSAPGETFERKLIVIGSNKIVRQIP